MPKDQNDEPRYQEFEDPETGDNYVIRGLGPLPRLARDCLARLDEDGLHTKWRSKDDDIRPVRLKESGQTFWPTQFCCGDHRASLGLPYPRGRRGTSDPRQPEVPARFFSEVYWPYE